VPWLNSNYSQPISRVPSQNCEVLKKQKIIFIINSIRLVKEVQVLQYRQAILLRNKVLLDYEDQPMILTELLSCK